MGKNQGLIRVYKGFKRALSLSEQNRGYIFITVDPGAKKKINNGIILIDNKVFNKKNKKHKFIDKYGRLSVGTKMTKSFGNNEIYFIFKDNKLSISLKNDYAG